MDGPHDTALGPVTSGLTWRTQRNLPVAHALLWTVVITATILDVLTTMVGLNVGLTEGNAVARAFIAIYGPPGIGLLKFNALILLAITWATLNDRPATTALTAFAITSLATIAWNTLTLAAI